MTYTKYWAPNDYANINYDDSGLLFNAFIHDQDHMTLYYALQAYTFGSPKQTETGAGLKD